MNLRFRMDKDEDRMAWDYLKTIDRCQWQSLNSFIIHVINLYSESGKVSDEDRLVAKIVKAVKESLPAIQTAEERRKDTPASDDKMDAIKKFLDCF